LKKVKIMLDFITVQGLTGLRKTHLKKKMIVSKRLLGTNDTEVY
jgi:hypothetical protein